MSGESSGAPQLHRANEVSDTFCGLVCRSPPMRGVVFRTEKFARLPIPVLIVGESGTGKELVARALWEISDPGRPFVIVDCGAIPPALMESELFGHERGAFTGAVRRHTGLLAQADGGILFLDEIAELPLHAQAKLLRAIETHEFRPVGGEVMERSEFRVIAATHRDLDALARDGQFRDDLLHRLGAARITMPALRDRLEDIRQLVSYFLHSVRANGGGPSLRLSERTMRLIRRAEWPGNVRQLRNVIEAGAALATDGRIEPHHIAEFIENDSSSPSEQRDLPTLTFALARAETATIRRALAQAGGNRTLAARRLGISRATLYRKLTQLDGDLGYRMSQP